MDEIISNSVSTWFDGVKELVVKTMKDFLIDCCKGAYNSMFTEINDKINDAGTILSQSPSVWSSSVFDKIQNISESVIVPIAGMMITYVFCYEIIHMVTESNSMKTVKVSDIMAVLIKASIAIMIFSNSFKIIMAFFDVGNYVTNKVTAQSVTIGNGVEIGELLASESIPSLIGTLFLLGGVRLITFLSTIAIYVAVNTWFLEIYVYSSIAAIPFATFLNKEWGQIGYNYSRRIMALAFQSFFMLLCLVIYSARLSDVTSGNLMDKLIEIVGGSIILVFMLFKCGNISSSIFNAH